MGKRGFEILHLYLGEEHDWFAKIVHMICVPFFAKDHTVSTLCSSVCTTYSQYGEGSLNLFWGANLFA